jgi:hypothetical protein
MSRHDWVLAVGSGFLVGTPCWVVLTLIFDGVTMRRLRSEPAIRHRLGFHVMPWGDTMNVAVALCRPRWFARSLDRSPVAELFADSDSVYRCTSRGERLLARICYGTLLFSFMSLMASGALLAWG